MDSIRINAKGEDEDGQLIAVVGREGCSIVIDYGDSITTLEVDPKKLTEWCDVVSELASEHGRKAPRHLDTWNAA